MIRANSPPQSLFHWSIDTIKYSIDKKLFLYLLYLDKNPLENYNMPHTPGQGTVISNPWTFICFPPPPPLVYGECRVPVVLLTFYILVTPREIPNNHPIN